ncbi:hypothetical protein GCM10023219_02420 [Stakelama sediminis]|uniref:Uncharacterized membrane protein (DUF485 family) n=1 Tax=Stakelama sediminis TaxID=463200 RepID=A0A840Z0S1_9SPHN|nr:hypothetical protein [Stakelama sediminis]MBB5719316.1 uncharacterized membrane protein (DUF485 family) [Stakelama sediminis]
MSFKEKSAWAMGAIMLVTGVWYAQLVAAAPQAPVIGPLISYVLAVIVLSIIAQTVLAILSPREAHASADERERIVMDRAGNWSGIVLGLGVITAIIMYIGGWSATLLVHAIVGALIVAQLAEYLFQIFLFRRAV